MILIEFSTICCSLILCISKKKWVLSLWCNKQLIWRQYFLLFTLLQYFLDWDLRYIVLFWTQFFNKSDNTLQDTPRKVVLRRIEVRLIGKGRAKLKKSDTWIFSKCFLLRSRWNPLNLKCNYNKARGTCMQTSWES